MELILFMIKILTNVNPDNFGNYSINTTTTTTTPNLTNYLTSNTNLNNLDLQNYCSITSVLLNNAVVSDSTAKNTNYTFKVKK